MNDAGVRISIALATFNGQRYLLKQLESLLYQTTLPFELIVSDDQSSDKTIEILHQFSDRAPFPVRINVNSERLGWRGNFIKAAGLCRGDLIAFCDQDDIWYSNKLERMARPFSDPKVLLSFHNADLIDENGKAYGTLLPVELVEKRIPSLSRPTPWSNPFGLTQVFRRSLTSFNSLWPDSVDLYASGHPAAHDQWYYHLATNLGEVVSVAECLLGYRQHAQNAVGFVQSGPTALLKTAPYALKSRIERIVLMLNAFLCILDVAEKTPLSCDFPLVNLANQRNCLLLNLTKLRLKIYSSSRITGRVAAFIRILCRCGYGGAAKWKLGWRALVEDVLVGIPNGRAPTRS